MNSPAVLQLGEVLVSIDLTRPYSAKQTHPVYQQSEKRHALVWSMQAFMCYWGDSGGTNFNHFEWSLVQLITLAHLLGMTFKVPQGTPARLLPVA